MVPRLRQAWGIDFVIANGENAAAGRGITGKITIDLLRAGVAVVTTGDHIWDQKEVNAYIETEPRLLRPINYPPGTPGKGSIVLETAKGKVAVINVQGRTFMQPSLENPFLQIEQEVDRLKAETSVIFVDAHAETTSEKIALGRFLDGKVSVVAGTHTHVQTADEMILPKGTGYITDLGMCGGIDGIIGMEKNSALDKLVYQVINQFKPSDDNTRLQGVIVQINAETKKTLNIKRFNI